MKRRFLQKISKTKGRGSVAVESALIFPFFLLGVFFFIWVGVTLNDKAALSSAVTRALRLAATRGNFRGAHGQDEHQILDIEDWHSTGIMSPRLKKLLINGVDEQDALTKFYLVNDKTTRVFDIPLDHTDLPASHTYALVYFYEAIKQSIGATVRFPCDPLDADGTDPQHGFGCVYCQFLNPDSLDDQQWTRKIPANSIAMSCEFRQASFLIGPVTRLLNQVTGGQVSSTFILEKTASFTASRS